MKAMFPKLNALINKIVYTKNIEYILSDDPARSDSFHKIQEHYLKTGKLIIWSGGSSKTIFSNPTNNYKFRAWHDWHHINEETQFTLAGEYKTYLSQMNDVMDYSDSWLECKLFGTILDIEINGQAKYYNKHGYFPDDQREFMLKSLAMESGYV